MDQHCQRYCDIFKCRKFLDEWYYTFVTQALDEFEESYEAIVPLPRIIVDDTDLAWLLGPELETLAFCVEQARTHADPKVRAKHKATLDQYRSHYPKTFAALEPVNFKMEAVSTEFDWSKVRGTH